MAKKGDESKKTQQKKKAQIIEDRTFGLKNKNKSKKVQEQIKSIEKNVLNSGDPKMRKLEEQRRQAKVEAKARKKAMEDERNALFGEALLAVQKKSGLNQKFGKIEAKGRDADDDATKKQTSRAMKMMYQMDAQEMSEKLREDPNYVPTIEDAIEEARQRKVEELKKAGKGTPVTPETFAAWQERKRQKRAEQAKKAVEAEFRKKKGKGLSVLTGRALYEYKQELFQDMDDDAEDGASLDGNEDDNADDDAAVTTNHAASKQQQRNNPLSSTTNENGGVNGSNGGGGGVDHIVASVQSDLFLDGVDYDDDDTWMNDDFRRPT